MFESLVRSIENTFVKFTPRRFLYVLFLVGLVVGSLIVFNEMTGYGYSQRIESRISALERLQELDDEGITKSEKLSPIYNSLVSELKTRPFKPFSFGWDMELILRIMSSSGLPIIFIFMGAWQIIRGDPEGKQLLFGALFVTTILAIPAIYIPIINSIWINVVIYVTAQAVILFLLNKFFGG